jgi:hypothetical protein
MKEPIIRHRHTRLSSIMAALAFGLLVVGQACAQPTSPDYTVWAAASLCGLFLAWPAGEVVGGPAGLATQPS